MNPVVLLPDISVLETHFLDVFLSAAAALRLLSCCCLLSVERVTDSPESPERVMTRLSTTNQPNHQSRQTPNGPNRAQRPKTRGMAYADRTGF
jgi:hypothetical protein